MGWLANKARQGLLRLNWRKPTITTMHCGRCFTRSHPLLSRTGTSTTSGCSSLWRSWNTSLVPLSPYGTEGWMWCYKYYPFSSRFRDFSKKNQHHWNPLQHRDSISASVTTQCVHLRHRFTPAGPCSGFSSYRLSLSLSFRSCSWLLPLFALQVLLAVFCLVHIATCTRFWAANF